VSKFSSHVLDHLELYLVGFSVAIALALPFAIEVGTNDQELAVTALGACVVQGLVFWALRRRYRRVRLEMIAELRAMLKDRINNQLTIVLMSVTQRRDSRVSQAERELLEAAMDATVTVSRVLDELSIESLTGWKAKYRTAVATPPSVRARSNGVTSAGGVGSSESQRTRKGVSRQT
jgi:hypothetical protein